MTSGPGVAVLLALLASGCGAALRAPSDEARSQRMVEATPEPVQAAPEALIAFEPAGDECAVRLPRGRSGGVLTAETVDRIHESAEGPLSFALCGCVRPELGVVDVRTTVLPELGEVRAWTGYEPLDGCLREALTLAGFRPWRLQSDCIDCGPKRMRWPPGLVITSPNEPPPEHAVTFPIQFRRAAR
jgi:hypothetical protein